MAGATSQDGVAHPPESDLRDALGTQHRPDPNARIVCLVPSLTELLCELGLAGLIVGRTGYCIHPAHVVKRIAKVGGTKQVNLEKIRRLAPSHLIVNIDENERPTVEALAEFVPHVVVTHPQAPLDNLALYRFFGALFGARARALALCQAFETAWSRIPAVGLPVRPVLYLIWRDPWMTVAPDTYIGNMLACIGWHQLPVDAPARYPKIDLESLGGRADIVLLSSEPYRFTQADRHDVQSILPGCDVRLVDGEMLSWYGSRAIAGLDYLAQLAEVPGSTKR